MYETKKKKKERPIKTINLERQLLRFLLKDKIFLQRLYGACKEEWFTNEPRLFIYQKIIEYFENSKSLLTEKQFDYELDKCFDLEDDELKIKEYKTEFDICYKFETTDEMELVVSKLNEVDLATDINDLIINAYDKLESGDIDSAASLLRSGSVELSRTEHKGRIVSLHKDIEDWTTEIMNRREHPEKYSGISTGFPTIDKKTGGLFKAELTVVFGLSGKGKSTLMKAIGSNVRKNGYNVLHCGNEENEFQMRTKYQSLESGIPYRKLKFGQFTDEEFENLKKFNLEQSVKGGGLYIFEFPQATDATMIERAVAELELKGVHIDLIIVDYLDLMAPSHRAFNDLDEQGKVTKDLKQLAINCDVPVLTATQAGIQSEKQELRERPFLNASDVFGTKQKVHSANCLIGIVNQTASVGVGERTEEERKIHKIVLCCPKNRDGSTFVCRCKMYVTTGRIEEDTEEDAMNQAIEKQAMEMVNETNPSGSIRNVIDMKQVEDEVTKKNIENLEKIRNEIESNQNNGISLKSELKTREHQSVIERYKNSKEKTI